MRSPRKPRISYSPYGGKNTKALLLAAIEKARSFGYKLTPEVFFDSGCENINEDVDTLIFDGKIRQTIAQIMVDFSNSMIEAMFYRMKNRHLYRVNLSSFNVLVKHSDFYLTEANDRIPLKCLKGATPLECISGKWADAEIAQLTIDAESALRSRMLANRSKSCSVCRA